MLLIDVVDSSFGLTQGNIERSIWLSERKFACQNGEGVLGISDAREMNLALLSKLGWEILNHAGKFQVQVLRAEYFRNVLQVVKCLNPSSIWSAIFCAAKSLASIMMTTLYHEVY